MRSILKKKHLVIIRHMSENVTHFAWCPIHIKSMWEQECVAESANTSNSLFCVLCWVEILSQFFMCLIKSFITDFLWKKKYICPHIYMYGVCSMWQILSLWVSVCLCFLLLVISCCQRPYSHLLRHKLFFFTYSVQSRAVVDRSTAKLNSCIGFWCLCYLCKTRPTYWDQAACWRIRQWLGVVWKHGSIREIDLTLFFVFMFVFLYWNWWVLWIHQLWVAHK